MIPSLLLLALLSPVAVRSQSWSPIFRCTPDSGFWTREGGIPKIAEIANFATQVKICSYGTNDCVISKANTFPILNLRKGIMALGHVSGFLPCSSDCVRKTWSGSNERLQSLQVACRIAPSTLNTSIYHACGNFKGLHYIQNARCVWEHSASGLVYKNGIEISVNVKSLAPTISPTQYPTRWLQNPGHVANITVLQARVSELEETVRGMSDVIETLVSKDSLTQQMDTVSDSLETLSEEVQFLAIAASKNSTKIVDALKAAVTAIKQGSGPSIPTIGANGPNFEIIAPGKVSMQSNDCQVDDLCQASAFASRLSDAINDMDAN